MALQALISERGVLVCYGHIRIQICQESLDSNGFHTIHVSLIPMMHVGFTHIKGFLKHFSIAN